MHLDELERVEDGGDEQDRIRSHQPGVDHVARIDGEVLAQHGQCRRRAGGLEVGDRTAEELLVGEHGEAGGATDLVRRRQLGWIEMPVEVALRR